MTKSVNRFKLPTSLIRAIAAFLAFVAIGTFFYSHSEGWSYLDSIYFSVISLATVGYGDLYPTLVISKIFTMIYIIVGAGLMLYIFTALMEHLIQGKDQQIRKMEGTILHLEEMLYKKEKKIEEEQSSR